MKKILYVMKITTMVKTIVRVTILIFFPNGKMQKKKILDEKRWSYQKVGELEHFTFWNLDQQLKIIKSN